jgi:hypothetical protein
MAADMNRRDPTYEELAEVIARHLHAHLYLEERLGDGSTERNVDNMCCSGLQIATRVLNRLDILVPLDDLARRNEFSCEPSDFSKVIAQNKSNGCSLDTLFLALLCLLNQHGSKELRNYCVEIGLCEPGDTREIKLTPKGEQFDALYAHWPELL